MLEIPKQRSIDEEFCRAQAYNGANARTSKSKGSLAVILMDVLMCTTEMIVSVYPSYRSAKLMLLLTLQMKFVCSLICQLAKVIALF